MLIDNRLAMTPVNIPCPATNLGLWKFIRIDLLIKISYDIFVSYCFLLRLGLQVLFHPGFNDPNNLLHIV